MMYKTMHPHKQEQTSPVAILTTDSVWNNMVNRDKGIQFSVPGPLENLPLWSTNKPLPKKGGELCEDIEVLAMCFP